MTKVEHVKAGPGENDEIVFTVDDGSQYRLYHNQDCCESVTVEDIIGNLDDLVGAPILMAEEVTYDNQNPVDMEVRRRLRACTDVERCEFQRQWAYLPHDPWYASEALSKIERRRETS